MIHDFDPKTMQRPYVQEIDYYQEQAHALGEPLVIKEWDNEYAPEVGKRLLSYIAKEPDKVHVGPYLTNIHFSTEGVALLFWAHRLAKEEVRRFHIEEKFVKLVNIEALPLLPEEKAVLTKLKERTVNLTLRYPAWVAGGEPDSDIVSLGFTYLPYEFWKRIYPEIQNLPWNVLDIEISARMMREGLKARLHWDCIVNHSHIDIREREKSVFRKFVGIDKRPLSDEEKVWLKVDKLPRYHGFIGEAMHSDTIHFSCPMCSGVNTWNELIARNGKCKACGALVPYGKEYEKMIKD